MGNQPPPKAPPSAPRITTLAAGTRLSRVHSSQFQAGAFNPTLTDLHWGGGRFDATVNDRYGYLYAGSDSACAIAEALLREVTADSEARFLPRKKIVGKRPSRLLLTADIPLVTLCDGRDLGTIGQDTWLVNCPPAEYPFTRRWGNAIRAWAPTAQGFVWLSRKDPAKRAYVLFADRFTAELTLDPEDWTEDSEGLPAVPGQLDLDSVEGLRFLLPILDWYNVTLSL